MRTLLRRLTSFSTRVGIFIATITVCLFGI